MPHRRCGMMFGKHGSADSWVSHSQSSSFSRTAEATGLPSRSQSCEILRSLLLGPRIKTSLTGARAALSRVPRAPSVPNQWFLSTIMPLFRLN